MANKIATIALNPEWLKKAGIELPDNASTRAKAVAELKEAGAEYVPMNNECGYVLNVLNAARKNATAMDKAKYEMSVELALIDRTEAYKLAKNADGKPYTSTLALARDVCPGLQKSTVANVIGTGRNVYLPAIEGKFGKSGKTLLELPPSTAAALKSVISDTTTQKDAISAIQKATKGGRKLTQADAKSISQSIRNATQERGAGGAVNAAITGNVAVRENISTETDADKLNKLKAELADAIPAALWSAQDGDITMTITSDGVTYLKAAISTACASSEPKDAKRLLVALRAIMLMR